MTRNLSPYTFLWDVTANGQISATKLLYCSTLPPPKSDSTFVYMKVVNEHGCVAKADADVS